MGSTLGNQKLVICCLGIFICYFYYGVLQEKITRVPYGDETFVYQKTLVFIQCCINAAFSYLVILWRNRSELDRTPTSMYVACSLSYMGAMLASNTALQYVNYPTQVLGKSCKPIPVMLLGILVARKRYPIMKYISVFLIVAGVALFLFKDKKSASAGGTGWGELLLIVSLTLDGLTGAVQERMRSESCTEAHHMMFAVNRWSILYLGVAIAFTGEAIMFLAFVGRHPQVVWNILLFGLTSAVGQNFIFMTVTEFGSLTCSVVTTTRKFFTILFSVLFFGNSLITRQWLGVGLVFTGLTLDALYGKVGSRK